MPHQKETKAEPAEDVVRKVLQDVAGRLQGREDLTYADVSEVCREVAQEHGVYLYV